MSDIDVNKQTEAFLNDLNLEDVAADAEQLRIEPTNDDIKQISKLIQQQYAIEQEIENIEALLKARQEDLNDISEKRIPELMTKFQITQFETHNGLRVKVEPYYSGKVAGQEGYDWLDANNHGDIIKGAVTIAYPRGFDKELLEVFQEVATKLKLQASIKEEVHHQTLKAWIKEMIEGGKEFPKALFNVYVGRKTKIKVIAKPVMEE